MSVPSRRQRSVSDVLEWLVLALLAAVAIKIVSSVISGFIEWARSGNQFDFDRKHRAGDVILQFTAFGDGVTGLLLLSIAGLVYWHIRTRPAWFHGRRLALTTTVLAAVTALAALLAIVGYALYLSGQSRIAGPLVGYAGRELSDAIIAGA